MEINDLINSGKEIAAYKQEFTLLPKAWDDYNRDHDCDWSCEPLEEDNAGEIPQESGVYNLIVEPGIACHPSCGYLMYVGETKDLNRRFSEYLRELDDKRGRPLIRKLLFMWKGNITFYYVKIDEGLKKSVQDDMISAYRPPFNIEMDATIRQPQKAFGP
jgi:excinuclease UvrABC nuclease subunit